MGNLKDTKKRMETKQLEAVQLEVFKGNGYAIDYNEQPSEPVQLEAVGQDDFVIDIITESSEAVQWLRDRHFPKP